MNRVSFKWPRGRKTCANRMRCQALPKSKLPLFALWLQPLPGVAVVAIVRIYRICHGKVKSCNGFLLEVRRTCLLDYMRWDCRLLRVESLKHTFRHKQQPSAPVRLSRCSLSDQCSFVPRSSHKPSRSMKAFRETTNLIHASFARFCVRSSSGFPQASWQLTSLHEHALARHAPDDFA